MKPRIRTGLTADGHIEAAFKQPGGGIVYHAIMDRRTGCMISTSVKADSDEFRWLIQAAREHVSRPSVDDMLAQIDAVHGLDDEDAENMVEEMSDKARRRGVT